jgi:hypothetical protein
LRAASLLVQNKCQQWLVYLDFAVVVFDEAQFPEFVHEEIYARAGSANDFRQSLLGNRWQFVDQLVLHFSITAEREQRAGEPLLGRIEELID